MSKSVNLLLLETVDNLGLVGDVVSVRTGYARNYLLPMGFATTPTEELIEELATKRAEAEAQLKAKQAQLQELFDKVNGIELTIERSTNDSGVLFGGISQHDIAVAIRESGLPEFEDRYVRVGEKMSRVDTYYVPVQLTKELKGDIVLHVKSDRELEIDQQEEAEEAVEASEGDQFADAAAAAMRDL